MTKHSEQEIEAAALADAQARSDAARVALKERWDRLVALGIPGPYPELKPRAVSRGCGWYGDFENRYLPNAKVVLTQAQVDAVLSLVSDETTQKAEQTQVWSVCYDSETPSMDGSHHTVRMAEQSHEMALRNFFVLRSRKQQRRNLRIETRFVTEWVEVDPATLPDSSEAGDE